MDASLAQQLRFETISNNLANVNTNGFKKDNLSFEKMMSNKTTSSTDFSAGPIVHTGNPLDVAIEGSGFFKVMTANGIRYVRDGAFSLNRDGLLVNRNGDTVLGENGPITIDGADIRIGPDGRIMSGETALDRLEIVECRNLSRLRKEGRSSYIFQGEDNDIVPMKDPKVRQQYLEKSNVSPSEEMIKMIEAFRAFESVQKALQNMDEVTGKMVNDPDLF